MMEQLSNLLAYLKEVNLASTALRMALALLFGGFIGMEREQKRHPAGFRTYMLVCLGAATTMMLSQYEYLMLTTRWADTAALLGIRTDVSRFGAQVINGVGFLGAGTIWISGHQEVKGLITAAGLWASACMGLAIGAGFYECTLVGFALIFFSLKFFPTVEHRLLANSRNLNLYMEFDTIQATETILAPIKAQNMEIYDIELDQIKDNGGVSATFSLRLPKKLSHTQAIALLSEASGVRTIDEI